MAGGAYSLLPTVDPGANENSHATLGYAAPNKTSISFEPLGNNGPSNPNYRKEFDFDGSGQVDEFEIYFANILDQAKEGKKVDLTDDVWSCAIYTVVNDLPAILSCSMTFQNLLRFCYIMLITILNLFLQFALLYWISLYVMAPSMKFSQDIYFQFHRKFFSSDGQFFAAHFSDYDGAADLCQFPISDRWFSCAVLFLWASQCFVEIRSSQRIFSSLIDLPSLPWGISYTLMIHQGLHETDSHVQLEQIKTTLVSVQEKNSSGDVALLADAVEKMHGLVTDKCTEEQTFHYLVCLTPITRLTIFILVLVPRMIIILSLMIMGCVWLTATDRFDELILNALALEFVVNVDNLLFTMFFPASLHHEVEYMKVAIPGENKLLPTSPSSPTSQESKPTGDKSGYYRSFVYLVMVFAVVLLFQAFQPVIPGFDYDLKRACQDYIDSWSSPRYGIHSVSQILSCIFGHAACFPYGDYPLAPMASTSHE